MVLCLLPSSWILSTRIPKLRRIWRNMIVQELGVTKLNILSKIEPNSLSEESGYLKTSGNKLLFSGFSRHFGFYPVKFFLPREILGTTKLFFYLMSLTQIRSQNLVPRKWSGTLRNFPLICLKSPITFDCR